MRKQTFDICENKDADQLRGNREADQRLCFRYIYSTIPLLAKSEISSLYPSSVCRTRSETPKTGFLKTRLNFFIPVLFTFLAAFDVLQSGKTGIIMKMKFWRISVLL